MIYCCEICGSVYVFDELGYYTESDETHCGCVLTKIGEL